MTTTKSKLRKDHGEPAAPAVARGYREDLVGWVEDQIALLTAGQFSKIDIVNIADELGDVAKREHDKLESALRVVLLHLLKWDYQPTHRSRSWVLSIRQHRGRAARVLRDNPSLKPRLEDVIADAFSDGRDEAIGETGLPDATFPPACPYDWSAIMNRLVEWDDLKSPED
ncbi:DUF29 domain-containing protein [Rhodopseudomonas palustris]|uniref:DUF29 domain-containing protein n=1 Tax=Rhodopseudomonas palustris TaxID=1076 RepID=UPI0020CDA92B|nr:DUF29 domain-containing protein [Rhodopseudomonas palustris]MCP9627748.1 DUF29 domain-containing protein [Rhodopseudomonas palustris]